ncbi:glycoside hydrolase family 16 protein, partial [Sphaerobolus stellatus SS14]
KDTEIEKPWMRTPDRWGSFGQWVTRLMFFLGIAASAALCYFGFVGINRLGNVCLEFQDDFSGGLDTDNWLREAGAGGFGNGEFQWYSNDDTNSFVQDGRLYIVPTLTEDTQDVTKGTLKVNGCTADSDPNNLTVCSVSAGGGKILPPVQSARISTRNSHSIQYGKIEVTARMPKGDWLWPAIWMLPVDPPKNEMWPVSGEIDIAEARGNAIDYPAQGQNFISSALHWGPFPTLDAWTKTWGWIEKKRESFAQDFHTYSLEWDEDFMRFYIDRRTVAGLELSFKKKSLFDLGDFPQVAQVNGQAKVVTNPYDGRGNNAPFDRPFYLIINVAAGGTSGWFPDNVGDKPWLDTSATAMSDFWGKKDTWFSTWPTDVQDRAMVIDSVKMWKLC